MTGSVNVVRRRLLEAANQADEAAQSQTTARLSVGRVVSNLDEAWSAPGAAHTAWVTDVAAAGQALRGAFLQTHDQLADLGRAEPVTVDPQDPSQGWKASAVSVDRRFGLVSGSRSMPW